MNPCITSHNYLRLPLGSAVRYRGQEYTLTVRKEKDFVLLRLVDTKPIYICILYHTLTFWTKELDNAALSFAKAMTEHRKQVVSRQYVSPYFPRTYAQ